VSEGLATSPVEQPLEGEAKARVLVAGASGLSGALAARLVWNHPHLQLIAVSARGEAGKRLDALHPRHRVPLVLEELDLQRLEELDAAIVAYPHGAAAPLVAELRGLGVQVVDLSADFRLRDLPSYERWYGPHGEPDLLEGVVYGLTELYRAEIHAAELVANPGCYPTATVLALAPLAEAGLLGDVVVSAASGVSGAGRGAFDFTEMAENFSPYGTDGHRHYPEIVQELRALGEVGDVTFTPHLLPIDQGLLASCFVTPTRQLAADELESLYRDRYATEPFVDVVDSPPGVRDVRETNVCRVHAAPAPDGDRILAFGAIDNLWKGAAGQAVQNLNLMLGLGEGEGLA
jgi:N-acetyl-gamma-glutamyl-phosphate reductase